MAVSDEWGRTETRYEYDPWGKQTKTVLRSTGGNNSIEGAWSNPRGFTDHEMLSDLGLVHMNGRVYDPVLGRFLSADPFIQDAGDSQSYNRYSYLGNNPLGGTDPSGYFSLKDAFRGLSPTTSLPNNLPNPCHSVSTHCLCPTSRHAPWPMSPPTSRLPTGSHTILSSQPAKSSTPLS